MSEYRQHDTAAFFFTQMVEQCLHKKRADALAWAAQAVAGAAALLKASGEHPGALKDAVCSPGGATIEGVRTLESRAFRGAVMDAVYAAAERSAQLG